MICLLVVVKLIVVLISVKKPTLAIELRAKQVYTLELEARLR
jgi:hypothetical protein